MPLSIGLWRDHSGVITRVLAHGHADGALKGENIVCAAVSVLLRTAYETLSRRSGTELNGNAPEPGMLSYRILAYRGMDIDALKAISDFLLTGLEGIQDEYPGLIGVTIETGTEEALCHIKA